MNNNLEDMSHSQLQTECQEASLSVQGSTEVLGKRLRDAMDNKDDKDTDEEQQPPPRQRRKSLAHDLLCPITHDLPFDPVTAMDGRIYERAAIEQHIQNHSGGTLRSPMTNEPMVGTLLPSPQIKALIENLILEKCIPDELAREWKTKKQQEKDKNDLLNKAKGGDADAMFFVCCLFAWGQKGFQKDDDSAFEWLKKARLAGSTRAATALAYCLLHGKLGNKRIKKNSCEGMTLLATAAGEGSDLAAFNLANYQYHGKFGFTVDKARAMFWYAKCLSNPLKHMKQSMRKKAQHRLETLKKDAANQGNDNPVQQTE